MSGAGSLWVLDLDGNRRSSTMQDLIDLTRRQDTFENLHIAHWLVQPQEIPQVGADRIVFATMLKNTLRPQHIIPGSPIGIEDHIEMAAVLAGSREEALRRPTFFENVCMISPLLHRGDLIEEIMLCAKYKIPMVVEEDANAGGTTPFTIAGTVAEQNANVLAAIMFSQMINSGTPCIYSSSSGILDMRDANYSGNSPEATLIHVAASQMAHYYHLPYQGANPSDSKIPDAQMGYERAHHFLTLTLGGCNIIHVAIGNLEMMRLASYEQCVIDNEILGATFRIVEGIEVTRDTLGIDVLKEVGPGGNFVGTDHTVKYLRKNRWYPKITDRNSWETWQAKGGKDMRQRANEEARRILASHHPQYVTEKQMRELDRISKDAQKRAIEKLEKQG